MNPTDELKHEHKIILLVLSAAEREAKNAKETGQVHGDLVRGMLDFFRVFVDRCHHYKEERLLFPKMQERGMPKESGPVVVMLHEHDMGRELVKAIAEMLPQAEEGGMAMASGGEEFCCATTGAAASMLADNLLSYTMLLRGHIAKEDNVLYMMADRMLTPEDQMALEAAFKKAEAKEMGEGVHEKYHRLAHELAGN